MVLSLIHHVRLLIPLKSLFLLHRILRPQICPPSTSASPVDNSTTRPEQDRNSFCYSFQSEREHCPSVFEAGEHHTMGASSAAGRRGSHVCIGTVPSG